MKNSPVTEYNDFGEVLELDHVPTDAPNPPITPNFPFGSSCEIAGDYVQK